MLVIALPAIVSRFIEVDDKIGFVVSGAYYAALWSSPFVLMITAGWFIESWVRRRDRGE